MDYFELKECLCKGLEAAKTIDPSVPASQVPAKPDHVEKQEHELYYLDEEQVTLDEAVRKLIKRHSKIAKGKKKRAVVTINPDKEDI